MLPILLGRLLLTSLILAGLPRTQLLGELRDKGMRAARVAVVLYARAIPLRPLPLLAHYFGRGIGSRKSRHSSTSTSPMSNAEAPNRKYRLFHDHAAL